METWDAITSRRNVREFTDEPLPDEALQRILEAAGARLPRATGSRGTSCVVTDRAQLQELSQVWQGGGHIARAAAAVGW